MDHHVVSNGIRCLEDVPVEEQLTSGIARPPAGLEVTNADPCARELFAESVTEVVFLP